MRRRTKILLQRLAILIFIIVLAVALVHFFKPKKQIRTTENNGLSREYVKTIEAGQTVNIVLPDKIVPAEE